MKDISSLSQKDLPKLARLVVKTFLQKQSLPSFAKLPSFLKKPKACFVSLHYKKNNDLRGCIGTIFPVKKTLWEELCQNALCAAFSDPRFPPLSKAELSEVKFNVDLLSSPQKTKFSKLNPKKLGLIVKTPDGRMGLLLPNIKGVKTPHQQLSICLKKGKIGPKEKYNLYVFKTQRYKEKE